MLRSIESHRVVPAENVIPLPASYRFRVYMQCSRWRRIVSRLEIYFYSWRSACPVRLTSSPSVKISVKMLKTE
jgi:hypothetical protein